MREAARQALEEPDGLAALRRARQEAAGPAGLAVYLCRNGYGDDSECKELLPYRSEYCSNWLHGVHESGRITWAEVLEHAFPAQSSAAFFTELLLPEGADGLFEGVREIRESLAGQARTSLGANDPDAWALLLALLPGFAGTLPELLTAAGAAVS